MAATTGQTFLDLMTGMLDRANLGDTARAYYSFFPVAGGSPEYLYNALFSTGLHFLQRVKTGVVANPGSGYGVSETPTVAFAAYDAGTGAMATALMAAVSDLSEKLNIGLVRCYPFDAPLGDFPKDIIVANSAQNFIITSAEAAHTSFVQNTGFFLSGLVQQTSTLGYPNDETYPTARAEFGLPLNKYSFGFWLNYSNSFTTFDDYDRVAIWENFELQVRNGKYGVYMTPYNTFLASPVTVTGWHHLIIEVNNSSAPIDNPSDFSTTISLTVDGQRTTASIQVNPLISRSAYFELRGSAHTGYTVALDEFTVWNRNLTTDERSLLWNDGSGAPYPYVGLASADLHIVSGLAITAEGENYSIPPQIIIAAPIGGGDAATADAVLKADTSKIYADTLPAFSVGNTNHVVTGLGNGTGYFVKGNNDFLRVGNHIDFADWTVFFNLALTGSQPTGVSTVVLSSMESTIQTSGLIFGINNANRLFFEYMDTTYSPGAKRRVHVQDIELKEHNLISVSADSVHQIVTICNHNIADQDTYARAYSLNGYLSSDVMFLGGFTNSNNDNRYTGFVGYMNDILVLGRAANAEQMDSLSPLFCLDSYSPAKQVPVYTSFAIVTGAQLTVTTTDTGVTGYTLSNVDIPDKDGINISVYDTIPVTGLVQGTGIVYLSGIESGTSVSYVTQAELLTYNNTYVRNFADTNLAMLTANITTGDVVEVYTYLVKFVDKISVMPEAYNLYDYYLHENFDASQANVYHNGILQVTGIDYFLSSGKIIAANPVQYKSTFSFVLYDEISGTTFTSGFTGHVGAVTINPGVDLNAHDVYIDGQKLISGFDYTAVGTAITLVGTEGGNPVVWASGTFAFPPIRTDTRNSFTGTNLGYAYDFSSTLGRMMDEMVWLNGQRLAPGIDYLTVPNSSLLNTNNRPPTFGYALYDKDVLPTYIYTTAPDVDNATSDTPVALDIPEPII